MQFGLEGKVAVITGAGGGIGGKIAEAFDKAGCKVVVCDIQVDRANETLAKLEGDSMVCVKDLSRVADCNELVQETVQHYGRLDILVNAAAILKRIPLEEVDETLWNRVLDVNLKNIFYLSVAACKEMQKQKHGRIINFSSQGGFTGGLAQSALYNMTKGAILTLTKSFARSYAQDNITVNAIAPGMIDTEMMKLPASELERLLEIIPMKRLGEPEEVAGTALFLASDLASYITGATIDITGGQLMR